MQKLKSNDLAVIIASAILIPITMLLLEKVSIWLNISMYIVVLPILGCVAFLSIKHYKKVNVEVMKRFRDEQLRKIRKIRIVDNRKKQKEETSGTTEGGK